MKYRQFEELPVWQAAIELAGKVFALTRSGALSGRGDLRNQIERAVISVSNNIAEGWERGTHEELLTFLYYARGSAGEVRSMLRFLEQDEEWTDRREQIASLIRLALDTSRQLGAWLESLKKSDDKGPRHRTEASYRAGEAVRRRDEFLEYLKQVQARGSSSTPEPAVFPPEDFDPPANAL